MELEIEEEVIREQIAYNIMHNGSKRVHYCKNCGCPKHNHVVVNANGDEVTKNTYYRSVYCSFGRCLTHDSCNHFERAFV